MTGGVGNSKVGGATGTGALTQGNGATDQTGKVAAGVASDPVVKWVARVPRDKTAVGKVINDLATLGLIDASVFKAAGVEVDPTAPVAKAVPQMGFSGGRGKALLEQVVNLPAETLEQQEVKAKVVAHAARVFVNAARTRQLPDAFAQEFGKALGEALQGLNFLRPITPPSSILEEANNAVEDLNEAAVESLKQDDKARDARSDETQTDRKDKRLEAAKEAEKSAQELVKLLGNLDNTQPPVTDTPAA